MSVPAFVPAIVPADGPADGPAAGPASGAGRGRSPAYLTGGPHGWRFQFRVPAALAAADLRLAGSARIIRVSLGPRNRGEAKRLALQLAALCQTVCFAAANARNDAMENDPLTNDQADLVKQVAAACQNAIAQALAQPKQAIALARSLDSALSTPRLVQSEVSRGAEGLPALVQNADALSRSALANVLRLAPDPQRASAALAAVPLVAPSSMTTAALAMPRTQNGAASALPSFGEVSNAYLATRIATDGADHPELNSLRLRRQTFIDICGDRPVDQYFHADLQHYVKEMQFFPGNASKREELKGKSTTEIIDANRSLELKPIARKTLENGYVTNVRTMMRYGMGDHQYRDPFAGVRIRWPKSLRPPTPREGLGVEVLNKVFCAGVQAGFLADAMLPVLAHLTGRRLGLLVYLRGSDIRQKDGVMIAQSGGIVFDAARWRRVPIKTDESTTFFVLHDFLSEIGFVQWAQQREGFIFEALHEHPDPSKYASKLLNRLLRGGGAAGGNMEVFHSLRGDAIDAMRAHRIDPRARRLQAGHELGDEHERYGFRALRAAESQTLARMPLSTDIDWSVFSGLDFGAMAARRRSRGRPYRRQT